MNEPLIWGISCGFHDAALTITQFDKILFASHSERFSKNKHDKNLGDELLAYALDEYGVPDEIAYYEQPVKKKFRQLISGESNKISHMFGFHPIKNELNGFDYRLKSVPITNYSHHLSHAAAGFQTSPFQRATVVVIDAIGEFDTITIWSAEYDLQGHAQYKQLWNCKYPNSIGLFYSAFTKRVGLKPLDEEYIMMGMSAYGTPIYADIIKERFIRNIYDIDFVDNLHRGVNDSFLVGCDNVDIASSVQNITESLINNVMHRAHSFGFSKNLVYSGGVALNCLANRKLGTHFDDIWIMPNPGDAGSSLGAAALKYRRKLDWEGPYLGYDIARPYPVKDLMLALQTDKIVGVANGKAEFGPRALGNRSLLADPRGNEIKDKVNEIKRRQNFRPFAPVILEEHVHDYFKMPLNWRKSEYMQAVADCKFPRKFPAIVHVDNTSRVQTVSKNCKSGIRQLLEGWYEQTGCPMLLNTSLNIRNEPMVNDLYDAKRFEQSYNIRVL